MKLNEYLKEIQEVQIQVGDSFALRGNIGIFKKEKWSKLLTKEPLVMMLN